MGEILCKEELEKTYCRNVWGCISSNGIGPITKVEGRMKGKDYIRLISRHLLLYMQSMGSSYVCMDGNASCHGTVYALQSSICQLKAYI